MANILLDLKQAKVAALDKAGAILTTVGTRAMTEQEKKDYDGAFAEAEGIQVTIEAHERMASVPSFTNIPSDRNPRAPEPTVQVHDNWTDNPVLFGRAPRAGETPRERSARVRDGFGQQLTAIKNAELIQHSATGGKVDARLFELQSRAAAAGMSESVPADGGFLLQPDFSEEILTIAHDAGQVYQRVTRLPLSENTNAIRIPGIDEQSRVNGSRWGGIQMYWENEADALVGSKPKFRVVELICKKLTGLYYATNEVLADARLLGALALQGFGEEMAFKLDDGCIRGTGSGQLQGILNSAATVSVAKETGQAAATINYENIKKMWGRMWGRSRQNAVWFINQDCEQQLYGLSQVVGVGGAPVFLPPGGATAAPYSQLFARPVIPIEQCDTVGTVGDIILADMSQYLFVDKGSMQSASSAHVRFLTDEQTFRFIYRCDGQSRWHTALTPFKGTNTLSPFITLATR